MKCIIEAWLWKDILRAAYQFKSEIVFNFESKGLRIVTMDDAKTMLMKLEVPASNWKVYEPLNEPIVLSVYEMLKRMAGKVEPTHSLDLSCDMKKSMQFRLDLMGQYGHRVSGVPILALDEGYEEPKPIKKFVSDVKAKVIAGALRQAVVDAGSVTGIAGKRAKAKEYTGGYCFLEGRQGPPGRFVVWVTEPGTFNSSWNEFEDSLSLMELEVSTEKVKSTYGTSQLKELCDAGMSFSDICIVEFGENLPVKVKFELPFEGVLEFFAAPRIEGR